MIKILQENYLAIFSCKKSFIFSARLARFSARYCKSCKKNTCKIWIFLAGFLLGLFAFFSRSISVCCGWLLTREKSQKLVLMYKMISTETRAFPVIYTNFTVLKFTAPCRLSKAIFAIQTNLKPSVTF